MAIVYLTPRERSLLERIAYGLLAAAVIVLGFFFLAAAIVAGAILAGVILLRFWWLKRKLAKEADREFIKTEYTVIQREPSSTASQERPRE
jgi:predicted lipid-binding transport protein (Tim44 family)